MCRWPRPRVQTDQVNLDHAKRDWDRAQVLNPRQAIAPADYDTYMATYETARVTLGQDKAALAQAQVQVKEAQAAADTSKANIGAADAQLKQDRINLGYTKIRAARQRRGHRSARHHRPDGAIEL